MIHPKGRVIIVAGAGDYTGACKMVRDYALVFRALGWEPLVLAGDRPENGATCLADVCRADGLPVVEETGFTRPRCGHLIERVTALLQKEKPAFVLSCVQIDLKIVGPAARRAGVPYLVFDQTVHRFFGPSLLRLAKRWAFAREMRGAAGVVTTGLAVREQAVREFGCDPAKVIAVPNGIDIDSFRRHAQPLAEPVPPRQGLRLLNVGRLSAQKGQKLLVEAVAACRQQQMELDLLLVGESTYNDPESRRYGEALRAQVAELGLSSVVHFLGWRTDIAALHQEADLYVHSATFEGPPLPLAILEAMASRLPIILTDCVGWPEGFEAGKHGQVVKTGDAAALAKAIEWFAALPPAEAAAVGESAYELVSTRYTMETLSREFVATCERLLAVKAVAAAA